MKYAVTGAHKKRAASRRNALKLGLAGIAVAGVGAALTSAAWTDNVWFEAPAEGASFSLRASLSGTAGSWVETSEAAPLAITSGAFLNMVPGETRTEDVYVLNASSVSAAVLAEVEQDGLSEVTVTAVPDDDTLAPGASTTVTITLTTPEDWDVANMGGSGIVSLVVTGQTE